MKAQQARVRRPGVSLVELLVVMSMAMVVLTTSATLIHRIMRAQSMAYAFFDVQRSALRLAAQFRRDAHAAANVSIRGRGATAVLALLGTGDRRVEYRLSHGKLLRAVLRKGKSVSREEFSFSADAEWTIEERAEPRRLVLTLFARRPGKATVKTEISSARGETPVSCRVEACLARDRYSVRPQAPAEKRK